MTTFDSGLGMRARRVGAASRRSSTPWLLALAACGTGALLPLAVAANPVPGLAVSELMGVPTEEGQAASFTVVLTAPPSADVVVTASSQQTDEASVYPPDTTFTTADWMVPRTFWVTGVDDYKEDGDGPVGWNSDDVTIDVAVGATADPDYAALPMAHIETETLDDDFALYIESGPSLCLGPSSPNAYDGDSVLTRYDREHPDAQGLDFDPANPAQDDVVLIEQSDASYVSLRTLHVMLANSMGETMTPDDAARLGQRYATSAHMIYTATGGMLMLDYDQVVIDTWYGEWAFATPGESDEGRFVGYDPLYSDLLLAGYDVDDYDIVSISVAAAPQDVAPNVPVKELLSSYSEPADGGPWFTNGSTWGNDHTWTTVQYVSPYPTNGIWTSVFLHELTHPVEGMLEYGAYPEHRDPHDPWWEATYDGWDGWYSNLEVMIMQWARPRHSYELLPGLWGELRSRPATHVIETWCPGEDLLVWRRAHCMHGVECNGWDGEVYELGCQCKDKPSEGAYEPASR